MNWSCKKNKFEKSGLEFYVSFLHVKTSSLYTGSLISIEISNSSGNLNCFGVKSL